MAYTISYTECALKQLEKMDKFDARLITSWIKNHLMNLDDPRLLGKGLSGKRAGQWRYRVGSYRILCLIKDELLLIEIFSIGHRKNVYQK